ncbi:hypothetical protein [Caldimonas brevitalea]|uniref:Uncharacterized protein n=1 Tax=Caldimonas brevitalea TaxID=413882 RepID=A0A0G3BSP8_9BURK|nr:hypothetical protein [Caldimonas brevitalea]AKJ31028.1 hypothetical protein AAW51_4337 [Caldimonas brevitalea]
MNETPPSDDGSPIPLLMAADLQDHLMTATNDLERLQTLLADACDGLMLRFSTAVEQMQNLMSAAIDHRIQTSELMPVMQNLGAAVTSLQFQDMASQLIVHTNRRLRNCADRIAREAMGDDEEGASVVESAPLCPNPVTQAEMDAGSIDLF